MLWLRRLLGINAGEGLARVATSALSPSPAPSPVPAQPNRIAIKHYGARIVSAQAIDFMGQFAQSPNKRFTLLWQDRMMINEALRGGRYVLADDGRSVLDERMARPQDGKVANNGTFILNDSGASDALSGTFHAFAPDGREIVSRSFSANLLNNGLSEDGRLAVSQTCNAPGSPDSSVLCVFDLAEGREIACWQPDRAGRTDMNSPTGTACA